MRGTAILLACVCVLASAGCTHHPHSPVLEVLWVDFNIYERPAVFFDHKSHYPSKPQHVKYFRWAHQPDSGANMTGMPLAAQQGYVGQDPGAIPTFVPQVTTPYEPTEQAPAPSPEMMPNPADRSTPPPPPAIEPPAIEPPREEAPAPPSTPPAPQDKPLRYSVPNGPTAGRGVSRQQVPTQSAGWNSSSSVPMKSLLFAHP